MEKQITVSWAKPKEGVSKKGKSYTLYQISGEDGNLYSQFSRPEQEIRKGDEVLLECRESEKKGYFDITRIISVKPGQPKAPEFKPEGEVRVYSSIDEASEKERARIVGIRLELAIKQMSEKMHLKPEEINPDSIMLVELVRQMSSEKWFYKSN